MLTKTKPKVIFPSLTVRKLTDIEAVKHHGGWALKSYNPIQRTQEYKKMWRYVRASHSMNHSIYMGTNRLAMHIAEFSRFIAVDKDDVLRMLLQIGKNQKKPTLLVERLEWFKYSKELPF